MNELEVVSTKEILGRSFTVYGTVGEPLFLAKDVAEMIDYAKRADGSFNVSVMLKSIDEDEKVKLHTTVNNLNGGSDTWFLTENGLYEVLFQSRKPIAKEFKAKVKELLHDLRLNKVKVIPADPLREKEIGLERAKLLRELAAEYNGNSKTWKQVLDAHATKELTGEFLLPLPEVTEHGKTAEMIGKPYGLSFQKVGAIIKRIGITKTDDNGFTRVNKAKNCNKEIETFYYNEAAEKKIVEAIEKELANA